MSGDDDELAGTRVEKARWTDVDFDAMGWHDATVHALAFQPAATSPGRLLVDLDYIIEWVHPADSGATFRFWVSPATLVFDEAWDLEIDVNLHSFAFDLQLNAIKRSPHPSPGLTTWTLEGHNFEMSVSSRGYEQHLRSQPILSFSQSLSLEERGGISLAERGYD
jgi:hypothetical protein